MIPHGWEVEQILERNVLSTYESAIKGNVIIAGHNHCQLDCDKALSGKSMQTWTFYNFLCHGRFTLVHLMLKANC